jgi:hypothetical protein
MHRRQECCARARAEAFAEAIAALERRIALIENVIKDLNASAIYSIIPNVARAFLAHVVSVRLCVDLIRELAEKEE